MARKKIAFVGAGNVGATCAHLCFLRSLGDIILYDIIDGLPQGKALDMLESAPVLNVDVNVTGATYIRAIEGADCIVVTSQHSWCLHPSLRQPEDRSKFE